MPTEITQSGQTTLAYQCKSNTLPGHRYSDVVPAARRIFRTLKKQTKRHPYVRSPYFKREKIFFDFFWNHLAQSRAGDQVRRARYFPCALELLRHSRHVPITVVNTTTPKLFLHRFAGQTPDGRIFFVQISENRKTNKKQLMSLFPAEK